MIDTERAFIQASVNGFLSQNKEKYETITNLQTYLLNMTKDTYNECIQFIQKHLATFFGDHASAIFFFNNIIHMARFNCRNFELVLDVCVHFQSEMQNAKTTERELISISTLFTNSIFYLYSKNFFSIETIIEESFFYDFLFIYFLPEIEKHDYEYAEKRGRSLRSKSNDDQAKDLLSFYNDVKKYPNIHIQNREKNFHPSKLYESIRNDDIETFQMILSQNNYNINHKIKYSHYERMKTHDENISLIQAAAVYGSLKVFKFLWMQNDILFDENLLKYAYCGSNSEIIHLCETKCSPKFAYIEPIATQKFHFLDYFIENFRDEIIEYDEDVKSKIEEFADEDDENMYSILDYEGLYMAVLTFNFRIIEACFSKIVYIAKNVENINDIRYQRDKSLLESSIYNYELFKFIYSQKNHDVDISKCGCYNQAISCCLFKNANDAFKFLFTNLQENVNILNIFQNSLVNNHDIANYLIDLQIDEKKSGQLTNSIYIQLTNVISFDDLMLAVKFYNEDIIIKMINLYDGILEEYNFPDFARYLRKLVSYKMFISLLNRLSTFLPQNTIDSINNFYNS